MSCVWLRSAASRIPALLHPRPGLRHFVASPGMFFPAAERNQKAILEVLASRLDKDGQFTALEPASGSGQHMVCFAKHFTKADWQPTEVSPKCLEEIERNRVEVSNIRPPVMTDCSLPAAEWNTPLPAYDVIINSNMIHITPYAVCEGFIRGAGRLLNPGGMLFIYGPFAFDGVLQPDSNIQFHKTLVRRNPEWGVRDVADLKHLGREVGLIFAEAVSMPANNHIVIFTKDKTTA